MNRKVGCWVWPVIVIGSLLFIWGFCIGSISLLPKPSGTSVSEQSVGDAFIGVSVVVILPLIIGLSMLGIGIYSLRRKNKQPSSVQNAPEITSSSNTIGSKEIKIETTSPSSSSVFSSSTSFSEARKVEPRCAVCGRTNAEYLRDLRRKDPNVYIIIPKFIGVCPVCAKGYCVEHAAYDGTIDHEVCPVHKQKLE